MKAIQGKRGVVLAAALACLFLAVLLSAGLAASALSGRRRMEQHAQRQQAVWLAESGASRAAAQLRQDSNYTGETWSIPAAELGGRHAGKAVITVSSDRAEGEETETTRHVTVEAYYPDDPVKRTRVVKEIAVRLDAGGDNPLE